MLGRTWDDPELADVKAQLGDVLVGATGEVPRIRVGGAEYTAADICSLLLDRVRELASERLGSDVRQTVLAVPADYGAIQRETLRSVARDAGLEVLRLVNEPTAAALFRGLGAENRTFAIYDLGGGTFDISIVDVGDGVFEVLASAGDPFLGGEDIDARLVAHVLDRAGLDLEELTISSRLQLRATVEALKRQLSQEAAADLTHTVSTLSGREVRIELSITREQLQDLVQDLVDRSLVICGEALQLVALNSALRGALSVQDVDEVVLVGGTTHLPFIEECVARYFGRTPTAGARREDAVALGCAVYAGVLMGRTSDALLLDVTPRSYGLQIDGGPGIPMVARNVTHPTLARQQIRTGPASGPVRIRVFEGESLDASTLPTIDELDFEPARGHDGTAWLELTLQVDADAKLELRVADRLGGGHVDRPLLAGSAVRREAAVRSGAEAVAPSQTRPLTAGASPARRILAVATEWSSGAGGLSTLNRELCLALAASGQDVRCIVLTADAQERQAAERSGVRLIVPDRSPGQSEQVALARRPHMEEGWEPDIVIGHGRVTGPPALVIAEDHFPNAERMHLIHMAPNEIEWFKLDRSDDASVRSEQRTKVERELGEGARYVVAVGPKLHNRYLMEFAGMGRTPLRLDPGFDSRGTVPLAAPPGHPLQVTFIGRAEDEQLKGLDIAAKAVGSLSKGWWGPPIELVVRGAPPEGGDALRSTLLEYAGNPALKLVVHAFTPRAEDVTGDLRRSSLVIMPSRSEGFGLVGLEAISAGVPVLVSSESGLADLLRERLGAGEAERMVVPVSNDLAVDGEVWAAAIRRVLTDRDAAFADAASLRTRLGESASWTSAVKSLLDQMDQIAPRQLVH